MTTQERRELNEWINYSTQLKEAVVSAIATIDQADGSRIGLQDALDSARETLAEGYGSDDIENDVNEFLGIETIDGEIEEDDENSDED